MGIKLGFRDAEGATEDLPREQELLTGVVANPAEMRNESEYKTNTFDTGIKAWLQVFGAFFLWFNTW